MIATPNLDLYLKDQAMTYTLRRFKRPEELVLWAWGVALLMIYSRSLPLWWGIPAFGIAVFLSYVFRALRTKSWSIFAQVRFDFDEVALRSFRAFLQRRRRQVPDAWLEKLESAALLVREVQILQIDAMFKGIGGPAFREAIGHASKVANREFNRVIGEVHWATVSGTGNEPANLEASLARFKELSLAAKGALSNEGPNEDSFREAIAHLEALREANSEVDLTR